MNRWDTSRCYVIHLCVRQVGDGIRVGRNELAARVLADAEGGVPEHEATESSVSATGGEALLL